MSLEEPEQHQYGGGGGEHPDALLAATSIPYSQVNFILFVSADTCDLHCLYVVSL